MMATLTSTDEMVERAAEVIARHYGYNEKASWALRVDLRNCARAALEAALSGKEEK